jgi:glycosyltransferase involved in cell wall biosynthesis
MAAWVCSPAQTRYPSRIDYVSAEIPNWAGEDVPSPSETPALRLGYYTQTPYFSSGGAPFVTSQEAVLGAEFLKHCSRVVFLMHSSNASALQCEPLPPGVEVVDLGPLVPHWRRMAGSRSGLERVRQVCGDLDAVIIRGPTSLLPHMAKAVTPALPVFYLAGFWSPPTPGEFRAYGRLRGLGIRLMMWAAEWQQRKAFRRGLLTGNNPGFSERYGRLAPFLYLPLTQVLSADVRRPSRRVIGQPARILSIGRVDPDKQIEAVVKACAALRGEFDFVLDIVGEGLPAYVAHLRRLVSALGIEDAVAFHGWVSFEDTASFYRRADVFCFHTGNTEGFPRTIWEAFAQSTPVVAADFPGASLVLRDGETALLVPRCDVGRLADALRRILTDDELRYQLACGGAALIRHHALDVEVPRLVAAIRDALAARVVAS